MKLQQNSIGFRLIALVSFFLLCIAALCIVSWQTLQISNEKLQQSMRRATEFEHAIDVARSAQVDYKMEMQEWKNMLLRSHNAVEFEHHKKAYLVKDTEVLEHLENLVKIFDALNLETALVGETIISQMEISRIYQDVLQKLDPNDADFYKKADALVKGMDRTPDKRYDNIVTYIIKKSRSSKSVDQEESQETYRLVIRIFGFWIFLVMFISIALSTRIISQIRKQLSLIMQASRSLVDSNADRLEIISAIADGNLEREFRVSAQTEIDLLQLSSDEVGDSVRAVSEVYTLQNELDSAFKKMTSALRKTRADEYARDWVKSGLNELNALMRGEQDIRAMAEKILIYLVERLQFGAAAFYAYDNEIAQLQLVAKNGLPQNHAFLQTLEPGVGLIGQALQQKSIFHSTKIPANYLPISSALGQLNTCSVVIIPLIHRDNHTGAIELAAFKELSALELSFLEQIKEPIAICFDVNLSRQRTAALLEETKQQTEELRVQQEELQQINEELEERAEMLKLQREQIRIKNTELEVASRDIQQRSTELEMVSAYKSEFLANMSHELRTPLNSMLILSELLRENRSQNLSEKQVEYASTINNAGKDLLNLINDILDLSKVESGQIEFQYELYSPLDVLNSLRDLFKVNFEQKSIHFKTELAEEIPQELHLDIKYLQQILKNLISNSLKFTDHGEVSLGVNLATQVNNPLSVAATAWSVNDSGIGIAEDKKALVFEAFKQADGGISRKYGGTGLGLSISRQLARKMGGELLMSSEVGIGSTFTLYLPIEPQPDFKAGCGSDHLHLAAIPGRNESAKHAFASIEKAMVANEHEQIQAIVPDDRAHLHNMLRSILIIEDDQNFAGILMDFVRERGYAAIVAVDGETGIALAGQYQPSAILLDVMRPKIDGWSVVSGLKDNLATRHIPVHFIPRLENRIDTMEMGTIFQVNENALSSSAKKLLIVEDDEIHAKSLLALLSVIEVEISLATTGAEAIALLYQEHYDCIVLDLGLSDISGLDLLKHAQTLESAKQIPVIIHSGKELSRDQENELFRYVDSIIVKGEKSQERLLNEVTLFLHMVESKPDSSRQKMIQTAIDKNFILTVKKVLLVDDDMRNIYALKGVLVDAGLDVVDAENGVDALKKLDEIGDFDIVLMDIMMPELDGFETMRRIRADARFQRLPIIAMTAKAMLGDQSKCIEAGANDYISKPIDTAKLLGMIKAWTYH
ncbi:MAG: response regulator [Rhodoferax sp.]|nr:response regulator [Rhodoferax sp.]